MASSRLDKIKFDVEQLIKNDTAHDFLHVMRVYKNATVLCKREKIRSPELVLAAVLLHDLVSFKKTDPKNSGLASTKSAIKAKKILNKHGYNESEITLVCDAIRDHSFSKNVTPKTLEAQILQDADRLDAIGAVGIARVFAVSGYENRPFYNASDDPFCKRRKPDDYMWTLDHFYKKLLKLEKMMNTKTGQELAVQRTRILHTFLKQFEKEI